MSKSQQPSAGGGEIPIPFALRRIPLYLFGIVVPETFNYCMDGAHYILLHHDHQGQYRTTRLHGANKEVEDVLKNASGTRQRIMVAGYLGGGVEAGCTYLNCYHADNAWDVEDIIPKLIR